MFINLLKFEISKFIDSASVFFKSISVYYLRRLSGCPLYGREDNEKGGQRNRKATTLRSI